MTTVGAVCPHTPKDILSKRKSWSVSRTRWHILRDDAAVTVARHLPVRFDVAAETVLPVVARQRLAQQIRQDLWRALQHLRGFSPVVRVEAREGALRVTAGGRCAGAFHQAHVQARIASVLEDPQKRQRWLNYARPGGQGAEPEVQHV